MLRRFCVISILLFIFSISTTIQGNESAKQYFPATLGSYWIYEDQDGNELTRRAVEGEEIAGETYYAFNYEPAFEEWEDYQYHVHPTFFKVDDTGIKFQIGNEVKKAYKERITKELEGSIQQGMGIARPDFEPSYEITVEVVSQDYFYFLRTPSTPNEEWDTMRIKPTVKIMMGMGNDEVDAELAGMSMGTTLYFTIMETGMVTGDETVETAAGTFKDCLKIEYRTETVMPSIPGQEDSGPMAGETVSKLWLAPNVGIVKFHQEYETPLLSDFNNPPTITEVKTLELKKYEIKTDTAGAE